MSAPWFHLAPLPEAGGLVLLPREEAKHALGSRRLSAGDEVVLFDGRGTVAHAVLGGERARDGSLSVAVRRVERHPRPQPLVTLASALPKGDRLATLADAAGQLGVANLVPLDCARSVVRCRSLHRERVERILLEACKQCRRPWCPQLDEGATPLAAVQAALGRGDQAWLAHPGGQPASLLLEAARSARRGGGPGLTLVVGPEGGFADEEVAALVQAGARQVDLGDALLRVETAGTALVAAIRLACAGL
ncbi:MAG: RsmE family RNA methyltransferase [Phycisphaerales bacterium]